jgi:CspA family cold shock protein
MRGTVKWFSSERGYGFVEPDEDVGGDVFVHFSFVRLEALRGMVEGARVEFDVAPGERGKQAVNVGLAR